MKYYENTGKILLYYSPNIVTMTKSRRLRLVIHMHKITINEEETMKMYTALHWILRKRGSED